MIIPGSADNQLVFHGACIRFDEIATVNGKRVGIPRIHHNTAHVCVGIDSIEVNDAGHLVFELSKAPEGFTRPIVTMGVWHDERTHYASDGSLWTFGLSGGNGRATMLSKLNGVTVRHDDPRLFGSNRNLWVSFTTMEVASEPVPEDPPYC